MRSLYFDCFGGASGDMLLGALLGAGARLTAVNDALSCLDLGLRVSVDSVVRGGMAALKATVLQDGLPADPAELPAGDAAVAGSPYPAVESVGGGHSHGGDHHSHRGDHGHSGNENYAHDDTQSPNRAHSHGPAPVAGAGAAGFRGLREIRVLLDGSRLPASIRLAALSVFETLAQAEGAVHGTGPEEVHFHEVGAADAIGDVVGVCAALADLGVDEVQFGVLPTGGGTVRSAHGLLPMPAPATLRLLLGLTVFDPGEKQEMVTPTGAALLVALGRQVERLPAMSIAAVGVGAGSRNSPRANVVRAILGGTAAAGGDFGAEVSVLVCETNVDDASGQVLAAAALALSEAGALDVWWTACGMKKGRPGVTLSYLCTPADRDRLGGVLFAQLPTLGYRYWTADRVVLRREFVAVTTPYGVINVKVGRHGERVFVATPEYEDCALAAQAAGVPVRAVIAAAIRASGLDTPVAL